jgi:predicted nucleotidyltransferase component of viral defense system
VSKIITDFQAKTLIKLSGQLSGFYLVGGTALSSYYFHHRDSLDLDFFTQKFSRIAIRESIEFLSGALNRKIELIKEQTRKDMVKVMVYMIPIRGNYSLKLDFVQDYVRLIKPPKSINGINIASLEDIYLRKLLAVAGTSEAIDIVGAKMSKGGRQEAKDFYDLYFLSHTFMPLSAFVFKYCKQVMREAIIRWFNTYGRLEVKTGLMELGLKKKVTFLEMERHFKREVNKITENEVDFR